MDDADDLGGIVEEEACGEDPDAGVREVAIDETRAARFESAALDACLRQQDLRLRHARARLVDRRMPTFHVIAEGAGRPPVARVEADDVDWLAEPDVGAELPMAAPALPVVEVVGVREDRLTIATANEPPRSLDADAAASPALARWVTVHAQAIPPSALVLAALPLLGKRRYVKALGFVEIIRLFLDRPPTLHAFDRVAVCALLPRDSRTPP